MKAERTDHFKSSAIPVAVVAVGVAVAQFTMEMTMPSSGVEARAAYAEDHIVREIRFGGAALLSVVSLLLVRGLVRDRVPVRARDDRLAGEYLAAGAVTGLVSAMTGAVLGVLVGAGVIAAVAVLRRTSADSHGVAGRDFRNVGYLSLAALVLYLGVRESYTTYAQWAYGYGVGDGVVEEYADERGAGVVLPPLMVLAFLVSALVLFVLWKHRARVAEARIIAFGAGLVLAGLGGMGGIWPVAVVGMVVILGAAVLDRSRDSTPVG